MDGRDIEPRTAIWAVAEVSWEDKSGASNHAPATLEDTSPSGACLRVKTPITVGSELTVKWHREQFSAIARNCRRDGGDFLLGVHRQTSAPRAQSASAKQEAKQNKAAATASPPEPAQVSPAATVPAMKPGAKRDAAWNDAAQRNPVSRNVAPDRETASTTRAQQNHSQGSAPRRADPVPRAPSQPKGSSPRQERKVMESKGFFPKLWRRQQNDTGAPDKVTSKEAPVNKSDAAEGFSGPQTDLLSYEDIYHAAGILSPRSGYGIHKVVEMLNSDRLRDLSKDVKRASVLMALDAAGTSAEDLLQDATRRQLALDSYAAGQQKQLEEFEARKAQENAQIQAELDRVTAHYAERIQRNHDQIAREKETLRNWQMAKQNESQRIAEVIELCTKQPAAAPARDPQSAPSAASSSTSATASTPVQAAKASAGS